MSAGTVDGKNTDIVSCETPNSKCMAEGSNVRVSQWEEGVVTYRRTYIIHFTFYLIGGERVCKTW